MGAQCGQAGFDTGIAENALFRPPGLPVEVDFLVRTARYAVTPATAALLVHQHDAVLFTLVQGAGRTGSHAGRVEAVFAQARQPEHEDIAKLQVGLQLQVFKIGVSGSGFAQAGQIILPIGAPLEYYRFTGQTGMGTHGWLVLALGALDQPCIVIIPRFVVVIDGGQVGIVKDVKAFVDATTGFQLQCVAIELPATFIKLLIFPFFGIADTGFAFDIVEPHVFGAVAVGPHILARDAAGVAADAFVQVQHHGVLGFNLHTSPPPRLCAR